MRDGGIKKNAHTHIGIPFIKPRQSMFGGVPSMGSARQGHFCWFMWENERRRSTMISYYLLITPPGTTCVTVGVRFASPGFVAPSKACTCRVGGPLCSCGVRAYFRVGVGLSRK